MIVVDGLREDPRASTSRVNTDTRSIRKVMSRHIRAFHVLLLMQKFYADQVILFNDLCRNNRKMEDPSTFENVFY
jgi:hypothetical protein